MPLKRKRNATQAPRKRARMASAAMVSYNQGGLRGALGGTTNRAVHNFIRKVRFASITQHSSGVGTLLSTGYSFQLSDLPSSSEFTTLFDQYMIKKVELAFIPVANAIALTGSCSGQLTTVIDYDDANALATEGIAFQYESAQSTPVWQPNKRVVIPRIATAAYSGTFTSFANSRAQWIDSGSPSVQHYGIKAVCPPASGAAVMQWDILATYYVACRNTR